MQIAWNDAETQRWSTDQDRQIARDSGVFHGESRSVRDCPPADPNAVAELVRAVAELNQTTKQGE